MVIGMGHVKLSRMVPQDLQVFGIRLGDASYVGDASGDSLENGVIPTWSTTPLVCARIESQPSYRTRVRKCIMHVHIFATNGPVRRDTVLRTVCEEVRYETTALSRIPV